MTRVQISHGNFAGLRGNAEFDWKRPVMWVRLDIIPDYPPMEFHMHEVFQIPQQASDSCGDLTNKGD